MEILKAGRDLVKNYTLAIGICMPIMGYIAYGILFNGQDGGVVIASIALGSFISVGFDK